MSNIRFLFAVAAIVLVPTAQISAEEFDCSEVDARLANMESDRLHVVERKLTLDGRTCMFHIFGASQHRLQPLRITGGSTYAIAFRPRSEHSGAIISKIGVLANDGEPPALLINMLRA